MPNFKICTNGTTRYVILWKEYAIKFPRLGNWRFFLQGMLDNMTEGNFGQCSFYGLAKVHYFNRFGFMLVMERTRPVSRKLYFQNLVELEKKAEIAPEFMLSDSKPENYGITRAGQFVKIDFN